jgi:hypothetical protein
MPVFIDDRADFYGEKFYGDYGTVCEAKARLERNTGPAQNQLGALPQRERSHQKAERTARLVEGLRRSKRQH